MSNTSTINGSGDMHHERASARPQRRAVDRTARTHADPQAATRELHRARNEAFFKGLDTGRREAVLRLYAWLAITNVATAALVYLAAH
jgi:hypothetical protein